MRKVEREMLDAIRMGVSWSGGNTFVTNPDGDGWQGVYLHGNHIADANGQYSVPAKPDRETFRAYPTATTRSRLRALGVAASVRNGVAHIGNEPA